MNSLPALDLHTTPAEKQWKRIGVHDHHGVDIALFSLRSERSGGIGEYPDLIPLIHWCKGVGFDTLQLLPIQDTGMDNSPYSARSAFALNPLHLGLLSLPNIARYSNLLPLLDELKSINSLKRVHYDRVRLLKTQCLKQYFAWEYAEVSLTDHYQSFIENNPWLDRYCLYKVIKEIRHHESWTQWPKALRDCDPDALEALRGAQKPRIQYYQFVQYLCFQQMLEVREQADKCGVMLKGDLPILVSRESADVWGNQELFHMELTAGAPPDMYAPEGQSWGFPIYNWDAIAKEGYRWWIQRLDVAGQFYHLYRLDHILGFFRIWGIPKGQKATEGSFIPPEEKLWVDHGRKILKVLLKHSDMLPIGEDLGVVPEGVRPCMAELGICGTRVMRWERDWEGDQSFYPLESYIRKSLTTVSTHDSATLTQWWRDFPEEARAYCKQMEWDYTQKLTQEQRRSILHASHHSHSLFHINLLEEYLALVPKLDWPNADDSRINTPGTVADSNWSCRTCCPLEEIIANEDLAATIRRMLS